MSGRSLIRRASKVSSPIVPVLLAILVSIGAHPAGVRAEAATASEMETVCRNWLAAIVFQEGDWAGDPSPLIRGVRELTADGVTLARCFSIAPNGHVVVPVLKDLPPVMVSSQVCDLDVDETDGPAQLLREILQSRARYFIGTYGSLDAVGPHGGDGDERIGDRQLWDRYLVDPERFAAQLLNEDESGTAVPRTEVGPLLTSEWHQVDPYNLYCPMGDGGRCVTGCVATATAQILNYHEWPPRGVGEWAYEWYGDYSCGGSSPGEWLWADYRDPYDWANMQDNCMVGCTDEQRAAVAELNYEVGVAYEMFYGHCGSGAMMDRSLEILPRFFRYDASIDEERRGAHTVESWFSIIQEEINNDRPILYGFLFSSTSGHAIVCDGWRDTGGENQYHMNYGWGGGPYNAWYAIDEIYHNYNPDQDVMYRRIMPADGYLFQIHADGSGYYPTIQAAIDDCFEGDILELTDGVFTGDGNRDVDFRGKAVTVRSESGDPATCIIDCGGDPEDHRGFTFVSGEDAESTLEGVTIANGFTSAGNEGAAIFCANGSAPTIRNCLVRDNSSTGAGAAIACSGASPTVSGCIIHSNTAGGHGGAVLATNGAQPALAQCTLVGNGAAEGAGVWVTSDASIDIDNTIIAYGTAGGAVACEGGSSVAQLTCCDLFENVGGDWTGCVADQLGTDGNITADPLFCDLENGNFRLQNESPCASENNPACGQIGALPLGCGLHVVHPDGTGDFPTIQAAIDASVDGDMIQLLDGIYTGSGNRDLDFCGKAITIGSQSGDPKSCILDCQGSDTNRHRAFRFHSGEDASAVVEGVTIRNGYQSAYSGGAVWCSDGSSPTFRSCIFHNNYTEASGGAVYCSGESDATFEFCTFYENHAGNGGGLLTYNSRPVVTNCTFACNSVSDGGGAICSNGPSFEVANSILAFNTNGGAVACYSAEVILTCCDVFGNVGGDWVGCLEDQEGQAGNICSDPVFCHPASGDFRLSEGSPCIAFSPPNEECDLVGAWSVGCNLVAIDDRSAAEPSIRLNPAVPNPFAAGTRITYHVPPGLAGMPVRVSVHDPAGRLVRTLVDARLPSGVQEARWDGRNEAGLPVAAGIYFCRLETGGKVRTQRAILVR